MYVEFSPTCLTKIKHGKAYKEHSKTDLPKTAQGCAVFHNS